MLKRVVPGTNLQEEREELSADDQDDISATQSKNLQNSYKIPYVYFNGAILVLYWSYIDALAVWVTIVMKELKIPVQNCLMRSV